MSDKVNRKIDLLNLVKIDSREFFAPTIITTYFPTVVVVAIYSYFRSTFRKIKSFLTSPNISIKFKCFALDTHMPFLSSLNVSNLIISQEKL